MPTIVDVVGFGEVEFPDTMTEAEIRSALESGPWKEQRQEAPPPTPSAYAPPRGMFGMPGVLGMSGIKPPTAMDFADPLLRVPGKVLGETGKAAVQGLAALGEAIPNQFYNPFDPDANRAASYGGRAKMEEAALGQMAPGYEPPPGFMEGDAGYQYSKGVTKNLSTPLRAAASFGQGMVETSPRLAAMTAASPALGVHAAGALAFGLQDVRGGFDVKSGIIGAALPFAGKWSGQWAGMLAKRLGVSNVEALNMWKGLAATVGPAGGMLGEQLHSIEQMRKAGTLNDTEAEDAAFDAISNFGGSMFMGPMGVKWEQNKVQPPKIPTRERPGPAAAITGGNKLTQLERAFLEAESDNNFPIEVKEPTGNKDDPFHSGGFMVAVKSGPDKGKILVAPGELQQWLLKIPENQRRSAMRLALGEEKIHLYTTKEHALQFWNSLTMIQKAIIAKQYSGTFAANRISPTNLGYEAIRIAIQRLDREGPREVMDSALHEKWSIQSMNVLSDIMNFARDRFTSGEGRRVEGDILERVRLNLKAANAALEAGDIPPGVQARRRDTGPLLPFGEDVAKYLTMAKAAANNPDEVISKQEQLEFGEVLKNLPEKGPDASEVSQAAEVHGDVRQQPSEGPGQVPVEEGRPGVQPQTEAGVLTRKKASQIATDLIEGGIDSLNITDLTANSHGVHGDVVRKIKRILKGGQSEAGFRRQGYSAAEAKQMMQDRLLSYADAVENGWEDEALGIKKSEGPAAINKTQRDFMDDAEVFAKEFKVADPEVFMRQLARHLSGQRTDSPEQQKLFGEFAARHPEYDKFFNQGPAAINRQKVGDFDFEEARNKISRASSKEQALEEMRKFLNGVEDKVRENQRKLYGPSKGYEENAKLQQEGMSLMTARRELTEYYQSFWEGGQQSFPAAMDRNRRKEIQTGLDFLGKTGGPKPPEPTPAQTGQLFRQMSPQIVTDAIADHLANATDPTFEGFATMGAERWGANANQLKAAWTPDNVWNGLMKASGENLKAMLYRLNLGRAEKIKAGTSMMDVNAPRRGLRSGQSVGDISDTSNDAAIKFGLTGMDFGAGAGFEKELHNAVVRATNAKVKEAAYHELFRRAKVVRAELSKLGFDDVNSFGQLVRGRPDAAINDQSLGLAKELSAYRETMDQLQDPQKLSRKDVRKSRVVLSKRGGVTELSKLQSQEKGETEMARPGFSPGLPKKVGSKQTREAIERRMRVIAQLGVKLLEANEPTEAKLTRRSIIAEDLALHDEDAIRKLHPSEASDIGLMKAIAVSAPEQDNTTIVNKVIGGKKEQIRKEAPKETETKNILVVTDNQGRVFLLSVYEARDGKVYVRDPNSSSLKRQNTELDRSFLYQFKPLYHLKLDDAVRNFIQEFKTKDAFRQDILAGARTLREESAVREEIASQVTGEDIAHQRSILADRVAKGEITQEQGEAFEKMLDQQEQENQSRTKAGQHPSMYDIGAGTGQLAKALKGRWVGKNVPPERLVTGNEADALWELTKTYRPGQRSTAPTAEAFLDLMSSATEDIRGKGLSPKARLALIALQKMETQMGEASKAEGATGEITRDMIANRLANAAAGGKDMFSTVLKYVFGQTSEPPARLEQFAERMPGLRSNIVEPTIRTPAEIAQENTRRQAAGLKPLGAGIERVSGSPGEPAVPGEAPGPSGDLSPADQAALQKRYPERQQYEGEVPDVHKATPDYYKYMMSGWPKFESLGERPQSTIFDNPAALNRMVRATNESILAGLLSPTDGIIRLYSGWMSQRLRESDGLVSHDFADRVDAIIDRKKTLYGELTPTLDRARRAAGGARQVRVPGVGSMDLPGSRQMSAANWLNHLEVVSPRAPNAAISRTQSAIEGTHPNVPTHVQPLIALGQHSNIESGQMVEPVVPGFVANGGFERHLTSVGYDVLRSGDGPLWQAWVAGTAEANNVPRLDVTDFMRRWKEALDEPVPDQAHLDSLNQEFARRFPKAVTHVRAEGRGIFGGWKAVIHSNLFDYLEATAQRASHLRSFREQFPATPAGTARYANYRRGLADEFTPAHIRSQEGKNTPAILSTFDALTRALQGHPTDQYGSNGSWFNEVSRPGQPLADGVRFLNLTVGNLMAKMVLTGQMITQSGELLAGSVPRYFGYRNYLEGMARVRQLYPQMEIEGSVNRVMYNWSHDPGSPITSYFRLAGNSLSKLFGEQFFNELQEASAAATAKVVSERIIADAAAARTNRTRTGSTTVSGGILSDWEKQMLPATFKAMGFQPAEIRAMMAGDDQILAMFQRRAAAFLTSGNKAIAEGSRLGANRLFNSIFRFQSYPMMKANQLRQDIKGALEARTGYERGVAMEQLTRNLVFNTMQGAITAGVAAMLRGGPTGWDAKKSEAQDNPALFLLESYFAAQGGPLYLVYRTASQTGLPGLGDQFARLAFPYAMASSVIDMVTGKGPYAYQSADEKTATFLRNKMPGLAPIRLGLSVSGLSKGYSPGYDAARSAYYRWSKDYFGASGGYMQEGDELDKEFRGNMNRAKNALIRGDEDAYFDAITEAVGVRSEDRTRREARQAAATNLRGKKVLQHNKAKLDLDQQDDLITRIGEKAYNELEYYDNMFEEAAADISPSPED